MACAVYTFQSRMTHKYFFPPIGEHGQAWWGVTLKRFLVQLVLHGNRCDGGKPEPRHATKAAGRILVIRLARHYIMPLMAGKRF